MLISKNNIVYKLFDRVGPRKIKQFMVEEANKRIDQDYYEMRNDIRNMIQPLPKGEGTVSTGPSTLEFADDTEDTVMTTP